MVRSSVNVQVLLREFLARMAAAERRVERVASVGLSMVERDVSGINIQLALCLPARHIKQRSKNEGLFHSQAANSPRSSRR